ncbi:hypothetical protein GCM10009839_14490 [Catenulispora yoronensis]|uniref:DUF222 domain-containing protein n=1 Tax=Catenulispora yoronensis TaxID=450799 RepID=A0ABN2TTD5_9ACTN
MPDDLTHAVPADPRAAVTALLHRLLAASNDPDARTEDALAFAVTEHASALRKQDPAAVTPRMIAAAEMLNHGAKALTDAANAAREELDAELDALGADATTGLVEGKAVYVDGADGTRYRLSRGHTVTKVFDDDAVIALIAAALRSEYRAPEGTPGFLAAVYGDAYEAGVRDGATTARAAIGVGSGIWSVRKLAPLARRLAVVGDLCGAGLFQRAVRTPKIRTKTTAKFEPVAVRGNP